MAYFSLQKKEKIHWLLKVNGTTLSIQIDTGSKIPKDLNEQFGRHKVSKSNLKFKQFDR